MGGRVGNVGATAEHGHGRPGVQRAAVSTGVDAECEATDDEETRTRQIATQLARDLAAIGAGAPGPDESHRLIGDEASQERGVPPADQRPRGSNGIAEARWIAGIVLAASPAFRRDQLGLEPLLWQGIDLCDELYGDLRRCGLGQLRAAETKQLRDALGRSGAELLYVRSQMGEESRAA